MVSKGLIGFEAFGSTHRYYPIINKMEYIKFATSQFLSKYFSNSISDMLAFYLSDHELASSEAQILLEVIKSNKSGFPFEDS